MKINKKTAILGFGREGRSLLRFLRLHGVGDITVLDADASISVPDGVKKIVGPRYLEKIGSFAVVYRTPGISSSLYPLSRISRKKLSSATELFFRLSRGTLIGITGTKGKGTTATLLYRILKSWKKRNVFLAGNIGVPMVAILDKLNDKSLIVLELSSFQLETLRHSPHIACVLNIFEDHLDYHKTMRAYVKAKEHIISHQDTNGVTIYDLDNKYAKRMVHMRHQKRARSFSLSSHGADMYIKNGLVISRARGKLIDVARLAMPGAHNWKNAMAAALVAEELKCPKRFIGAQLGQFRGNRFRLQHVATKKGVAIINDSASTNPSTLIAALCAYPERKIIIIGGRNKNLNIVSAIQEIKKRNVHFIALIGELAKEYATLFRKHRVTVSYAQFSNLDDAVKKSFTKARKGDVLLFSPGAASFDIFRDYEKRGRAFDRAIHHLT